MRERGGDGLDDAHHRSSFENVLMEGQIPIIIIDVGHGTRGNIV